MRAFYHHNWIAERLMAMTCYQNPFKRQNRRTSRSLKEIPSTKHKCWCERPYLWNSSKCKRTIIWVQNCPSLVLVSEPTWNPEKEPENWTKWQPWAVSTVVVGNASLLCCFQTQTQPLHEVYLDVRVVHVSVEEKQPRALQNVTGIPLHPKNWQLLGGTFSWCGVRTDLNEKYENDWRSDKR